MAVGRKEKQTGEAVGLGFEGWWELPSSLQVPTPQHPHTPNPNQDNFPYKFDEYTWNGEVPTLLSPHMKEGYEVGVTEFAGDIWCAMRVRENV
jgi:hypothetical protein